MESDERRRSGVLLAVLLVIIVIALLAAYSLYWITLHKDKVEKKDLYLRENEGDGLEEPRVPTTLGQQIPETELVLSIRKLRSTLLTKFSKGETYRFTTVFNKLELAASENRIDQTRLQKLPEMLRLVLEDGEIQPDEMETILDALEWAIIQ